MQGLYYRLETQRFSRSLTWLRPQRSAIGPETFSGGDASSGASPERGDTAAQSLRERRQGEANGIVNLGLSNGRSPPAMAIAQSNG